MLVIGTEMAPTGLPSSSSGKTQCLTKPKNRRRKGNNTSHTMWRVSKNIFFLLNNNDNKYLNNIICSAWEKRQMVSLIKTSTQTSQTSTGTENTAMFLFRYKHSFACPQSSGYGRYLSQKTQNEFLLYTWIGCNVVLFLSS